MHQTPCIDYKKAREWRKMAKIIHVILVGKKVAKSLICQNLQTVTNRILARRSFWLVSHKHGMFIISVRRRKSIFMARALKSPCADNMPLLFCSVKEWDDNKGRRWKWFRFFAHWTFLRPLGCVYEHGVRTICVCCSSASFRSWPPFQSFFRHFFLHSTLSTTLLC